MADKKDTYTERGLGDISTLIHNQGISDLSWLSVDEEEYRSLEALPRQNLDIIPELQKALVVDPKDDGVPHVIPLRPHTIVNQNPITPKISDADQTVPIRNRVAKLVMAGLSSSDIEKRVRLEFAPADIRFASDAIREVMLERGVLGNVYIDASHFPNAHRDPKERKYATTFGKNAIFVIGGCGGRNGCNCHNTGTCSTFGGKKVVSEVPWSASVASHYAPRLAAEKRPLSVDGSTISGREWKDRLRSAFLKSPIALRDGETQTSHYQPAATKQRITSDDVSSFIASNTVQTPKRDSAPSSSWVKYARRMMQGADDRNALVASTDPSLRALASEYGILGHTYYDIDALGGCRNTLSLINKRGFSPDYAVRRSASCSICNGASDGACAAIRSCCSIMASKSDVGREAFELAIGRAVAQGRVASDQASLALAGVSENSSWVKLVSQANLYESPVSTKPAEYNGSRSSAHYGDPGRNDVNVASDMDPEEVRKTLSHMMNTGLSGRSLQESLLNRYSTDDLRQVPEIGRRASLDDGIQGTYFIDPTAYHDYGKGCTSGAKHFRKQGAPYVLAAGQCTGCTLQTAPGWCSKYAKGIIRQVPAQVREHVAASRKLPVIQPRIAVENPVEKYELSSELSVDFGGVRSKGPDFFIPGGVC